MEAWSSWPSGHPSWLARRRSGTWAQAGGKQKSYMSRLVANELRGSLTVHVVKSRHLQNHPSLPASWCGPSAGAPPTVPCRSSTRLAWAPAPCAGCCCTSRLCCDCRTAAVKQKQRQTSLFATQTERAIRTCRHKVTDSTYKSIEHLVEHRSQAPPVDGAVVRLLLENLWGQVLRGEQRQNSQCKSSNSNLSSTAFLW